jgi:DNA-binding LytR/AlgR family response regulator
MHDTAAVAAPTAVIAEDEALLRQALREALAREWPELQVLAECENGAEALEAIAEHRPDVVFLDIRMPGLTGIEVAGAVPEVSAGTRIVFVTAFEQHALEAFDRGAIDYLLKPLQPERLARTVERLKANQGLDAATVAARVRTLPPAPRAATDDAPLRWLTASSGRETRLVAVEDVLYFRSDSKYTSVVTADGEALLRASLRDLLHRLDATVFKQVHRSIVVNLRHVLSITRDDSGRGQIRLKSRAETLPVSVAFMALFKTM